MNAYWRVTGSDAIIWSKNCLERPAKRKVGGELYASTPFLATLAGSRVKAGDVEIIAREEGDGSAERGPFGPSPSASVSTMRSTSRRPPGT